MCGCPSKSPSYQANMVHAVAQRSDDDGAEGLGALDLAVQAWRRHYTATRIVHLNELRARQVGTPGCRSNI